MWLQGFWYCVTGRSVLLSVTCGLWLCPVFCSVRCNECMEDLFVETFILLLVRHWSNVWMQSCSVDAICLWRPSFYCWWATVLMCGCNLVAVWQRSRVLGCCESIVRSYAYDIEWVFGWVGVGMSCMNKLNSVGVRTEPCQTPFV